MDCGNVQGINPQIGRLVVQNEYGYVVADIQHGEASVGDEIHGVMDDHGDQVWRNATQGERLEVYVEAYYASLDSARALLHPRR